MEFYAKPSRGLATYNDNKFLRMWYEVSIDNIGFGIKNIKESILSEKRWFPYNKGGKYRKWYGNNEYVVDYYNDGVNIKNTRKGAHSNNKYYFKKGLTWSRISSSHFGVRFHHEGFIWGDAGPSLYILSDDEIYYILGVLLSKITFLILRILNPTLTFQVGDLEQIPLYINNQYKNQIKIYVRENLNILVTIY